MRMTRRLLPWVLILGIFLLASCGQDTSPAPPLNPSAAAVEDSTLVTRGVVESIEILYGLTREVTAPVRLESGEGRIGAIYAWPGDIVTAGQVVARLDTSILETQIENFEKSIQQSNALHQLRYREIALEIQILEIAYSEALRAPEGDSEQPSSHARRLREQIEWLRLDQIHLQRRHDINTAEMEAHLDDLLTRLDNAEIRAAYDGEIVTLSYLFDGEAMRILSIGTWVNARDPIMYIAKPQGVFVEYTGMELSAAQIRAGARIQGTIGRVVYDLELIPMTMYEQLYYSQRRLEPPIRFNIIDGPTDMPPGALVFIYLYTAFAEDVLRIPSNALIIGGQNEHFVYRIEEGRRVRVDVVAGIITNSYVEILEGLNEGDEVFVRP